MSIPRKKIARTLRRLAADVESNLTTPLSALVDSGELAALSDQPTVGTKELLQVISQWGWFLDSPMIAHQAASSTGTAPDISGPQDLPNGLTALSGVTIGTSASRTPTGFVAANDKLVSISLTDCTVYSVDYSLYAGHSTSTRLVRCNFSAKGGGNSYVVRGGHDHYESEDCAFYADHSWRVYGCQGGYSLRDHFDVDYLRVGGGYANEWDATMPKFGGPDSLNPFLYSNGFIRARTQVTVYNNTHNVTFRNMDFTGTGKIFIDLGATNIRLEKCKNLPAHLDFKGASASNLASRGIAIVP